MSKLHVVHTPADMETGAPYSKHPSHSKHTHRPGAGVSDAAEAGGGGAPYSTAARKERSRELAQKRRTTYKSIMDDLTQELPFPKDVVSQLDYNSRLRLSLCFFRLKTLLASEQVESVAKETPSVGVAKSSEVVQYQPFKHFQPGMLQDMMAEALDGFLLVASSEGTIVYLSETVHHHLGIFQSEHIGISLYDIISVDDQENVRSAIIQAEAKAMSFCSEKRGTQIELFCRMKCSRFKVANTVTKSPGFKLVYISGSVKMMGGDTFLVTVVRPVSPPSILEIRMEANMFVTHYDMEMKCVFFDGRLRHMLGYAKLDLEGNVPYHLHHHEDTSATAKCSEGIMNQGEGLSGYYRFLCQSGYYVWIQTRGTLMHDSRTGKPTYILCLNYIISKDKGEKDLELRQAITANTTGLSEGGHTYDPFPITHRADGTVVNPLENTSWEHKTNYDLSDILADGVEKGSKVGFVKEEAEIEEIESGVHSGSYSSLQSNSRFSSSLSSTSGLPSTSSPSSSNKSCHNDRISSHNEPNSSHKGSNSTSPCLPDSTSDLSIPGAETTRPQGSMGGSPTSSKERAVLLSSADSLSPLAGSAELVTPREQHWGPLLEEDLLMRQFENAPLAPCVAEANDVAYQSSGPAKQEVGWSNSYLHGNVMQPQRFDPSGSSSSFQGQSPMLFQHFGINTMATACPQDQYGTTNGITTTQVMLPPTTAHPQALLDHFGANAMATAQAMCPQASFAQYSTNPLTAPPSKTHPLHTSIPPAQSSQGELYQLLTQPNAVPELPNFDTAAAPPPNAGAWSAGAGMLPQLTREDLDVLDFIEGSAAGGMA